MSKPVEELRTLQDLETFLREWVSLENPDLYDFVGIVHLMLACLENLRIMAIRGELETIGACMTRDQRDFFVEVAEYLKNYEDDDTE